jgi:hypothetical protein
VGTGVYASVVPKALTGTYGLSCNNTFWPFAGRTRVAVDKLGYTVWGAPTNAACGADTGGIDGNLGMFVQTTGLGHDNAGWDDNNNGCGCGNDFTPADVGTVRGYICIR